MSKSPIIGRQRRTNPVVWCFAIICSIIAATVTIAGIVLFSGYLVIHPKMPFLSLRACRLDVANYNYNTDVLAIKLTIVLDATNPNQKTHATIYDTRLLLSYHGVQIARLVANRFDVKKNATLELNYVVESLGIPLNGEQQYLTKRSLNMSKKMLFVLKGSSRTMWKVGPLGSVKFGLNMICEFELPVNGSVVHPNCSTKSR